MTLVQPLRIAMWSGPRNISTAMMRSWGSRPDTFVCDEPLYAYYLQKTGLAHPLADEIIRTHDPDWRRVVAWLTGEIPHGKTIFYQKQMAHHLLPEIEWDWTDRLTNCFLIREPSEMLTSLLEFLPSPILSDTGLPQQWEIFERVRRRTGQIPPVLDARDVLENPRGLLTQLCEQVQTPFLESMLRWEPGRRDTDGVWAKHWYAKVEQSTSFSPYQSKPDVVPDSLLPLLKECQTIYEKLHAFRLHA
jgi:hypothetical protein